MRSESVESTVFHVESNDTDTFSIFHDQVNGKVFDEEVGVVSQRLSVEGVQHGVSSSVSGGSTSVGLSTLSVVERLTTEGSLVDLSLLCSGKGKTEMLELNDGSRSLSTHVVDSILVSQPVGTLDSVVHVPPPVIFGHVTQCGIDTTLSCYSVRSRGEQLGDTGGVKTGLCETESGSKTRSTSSYDDGIVLVVNDWVPLGSI